jgi:glycosyltransferase involved in cell wall biosynthesis
MNVLFDYQAFSNQRAGGVSRYFVELALALQARGFDAWTIHAGLYLNDHLREARAGLPHVRGLALPRGIRPHPLVSAANRMLHVAHARCRRFDIYHQTYFNYLPAPRGARRVVTVFDMTYERFPSYFSPSDPTPARKRRAVLEADGIICISEATRKDLLELLPVPPERVQVVHLGVRPAVAHERDSAPQATPVHFLHVGNRRGYKNFSAVLQAFHAAELPSFAKLVCVGGEQPDNAEREHIRRFHLEGRIEFRRCGDAELRRLYREAAALVYVSRYEGFGLPPLEAMAEGCPVICSDIPVLRETAGDPAAYVDPDDIPALARLMHTASGDAQWRQARAMAGRHHVRRFTWDECARRTLAFYAALPGGTRL